ncbi:MAG: hypothetical protein U9R15_09470, partial [Chloroflexota bacterium]|nr:hypothetical protein [Chloroflexota bacterium]
ITDAHCNDISIFVKRQVGQVGNLPSDHSGRHCPTYLLHFIEKDTIKSVLSKIRRKKPGF